MTKEELEKFEQQLCAERDRLSHEIKQVIQDNDMGSDVDHGEEESDESEERGVAYGVQIALKERLNAVLDALQKIKAGTYGICEKCAKSIGADVLHADPESRYCKVCKAHTE